MLRLDFLGFGGRVGVAGIKHRLQYASSGIDEPVPGSDGDKLATTGAGICVSRCVHMSCVHARTCVYAHVCMGAHVYAHVCRCEHIWVRAGLCTHGHIWVRTCMYVSMCACAHPWMCICGLVCARVCKHM